MAGELQHDTTDRSDAGKVTQAEFDGAAAHILDSQAQGDIIHAASASQLSRLGIGSAGAPLVVNDAGTLPAWSTRVLHTSGAFAFQEATTISTTAGAININATTEVFINSGGVDRDFKVGNNAQNTLLWIDGETDRFIGIGAQPGYGTVLDINVTDPSTGSNHNTIRDRSTIGIGNTHDFASFFIDPNVTENNVGEHTFIAGIHIRPFPVTDGGGTETVINLAGIYIAGAPVAGTTPTNGPYSIFVDAGLCRFDGDGTDVFELPADATDPTSGGGAATGRIPVKIGGSTVYLAYY